MVVIFQWLFSVLSVDHLKFWKRLSEIKLSGKGQLLLIHHISIISRQNICYLYVIATLTEYGIDTINGTCYRQITEFVFRYLKGHSLRLGNYMNKFMLNQSSVYSSLYSACRSSKPFLRRRMTLLAMTFPDWALSECLKRQAKSWKYLRRVEPFDQVCTPGMIGVSNGEFVQKTSNNVPD